MSRQKTAVAVAILLLLGLAALVLLRQDDIPDFMRLLRGNPAQEAAVPKPETPAAPHQAVVKPLPRQEASPAGPVELAPPPPLPEVPVESGQDERKQAFGLLKSVDSVVAKDEPFDINGKTYTLDHIQSEIRKSRGLPEQTPDIGAGKESPYYGVHIVRTSENIWKIHLALLQEYLARRQVILPDNADRPLPNGRSSGVARLLKFIESSVTVYNVQEKRIEKNVDRIYPHSIIIFFKISDLFKALDQMQSEDWKWLRYVKGTIRLDRPQQTIEILDRRTFAE